MIVAGLGFRSNTTAALLEAAIMAASRAYGISRADITRVATLDRKAATPACAELSAVLDAATAADLAPYAARCITQSAASLAETGVPSLAEAAALWAAERASGKPARLLGPRIATGTATCALATTAPETLS